jgi:Flp pilus assembly protein TadD
MTIESELHRASVLDDPRPRMRATAHTRMPVCRPAPVVAAALAMSTLGVFSGAIDNAFVDWDDTVLFTGNNDYRGLGWPQLRWMFTTVLMGHYIPVTWLTHGLDFVLWGMDPAGYHFTSIVLHAANTALFFFIALRLLGAASSTRGTGALLGAAAAAIFFGVHPLRAESVAWVTERRDVLSALFLFLTLLLYLQARDRTGTTRARRHALALGCYLLAILSKSMVMTLPLILILLDVYPFRHLDMRTHAWRNAEVWREKVPYIALGATAALLGYWAQATNQFITTLEQLSWIERAALVGHNVWFYLSKTLLPLNLSPLYELPERIDPLALRFLVPMLAVATLTGAVVALRRRWPAGLAVWTSYIVLLSPVMGVVHSGHQLANDRYSYLPTLGYALLVGAGAAALHGASVRRVVSPAIATVAAVVTGIWFLTLALLTSFQVAAWQNTETLWRHALDSSPDCSVCEVNLGTVLLNRNDVDVALGHFRRALDHRADRTKAHHNIGLALGRGGDLEQAAEHFQRALAGRPNDTGSLMNLGVALMKLGRHAEALRYLRHAAAIAPDDYLVLANLGAALVGMRQTSEAVPVLYRAIERHPTGGAARYTLVEAFIVLGDHDAAQREYRVLASVDPAAGRLIGPALLTEW